MDERTQRAVEFIIKRRQMNDAAPKMYEALTWLLPRIETVMRGAGYSDSAINEMLNPSRAALAKATGKEG